MVYEVYAGGINAVSAKMDVTATGSDRYAISFSAYTKGFLGKLAPWSGSFESTGWRNKDGSLQPQLHRSVATWRGEDELKEYSYDRKGDFLGYKVVEAGKTNNKDRDADLTTGTTDVMTATLAAMQRAGHDDVCSGTADIFDGSRRFTLTFRFEAEEILQATRYNIYSGPAQRCVAEVKPVAGKWYDKPRGWLSIQEQGRLKGSLPTVWFAKMTPDAPAIPVKVQVKTDYGGMFMHLVHYGP